MGQALGLCLTVCCEIRSDDQPSDTGMHCDGCLWTREKTEAQKRQVTCPRSQSQPAMGALLRRAPLGWDPHLCRPIFSAQVQGAFPPSQSQQGYQVQECPEPPAAGVPWECEERCYRGPGAVRPVSGNIRALPVPTGAGHWRNQTQATRGYCLCWLPPRRLQVHGPFL